MVEMRQGGSWCCPLCSRGIGEIVTFAVAREFIGVYHDGIIPVVVFVVRPCGQESDILFIRPLAVVVVLGCCCWSAIGSGLGHVWLLSTSCEERTPRGSRSVSLVEGLEEETSVEKVVIQCQV